MAKYNKVIADKICGLLATGEHTIADVCKAVGIAESTFYEWETKKAEFSEAIKKARNARLESFKVMARSGLAILLTKHEYDEVTQEMTKDKDGNLVVKSAKRVKKVIMPNPTAVIFTLKNLDPDNYKEKSEVDASLSITGHKVTIEGIGEI